MTKHLPKFFGGLEIFSTLRPAPFLPFHRVSSGSSFVCHYTAGQSTCLASPEPPTSSSALAGPPCCALALSTLCSMFWVKTDWLPVVWQLPSSAPSLTSTLVWVDLLQNLLLPSGLLLITAYRYHWSRRSRQGKPETGFIVFFSRSSPDFNTLLFRPP